MVDASALSEPSANNLFFTGGEISAAEPGVLIMQTYNICVCANE
jgi:hypothetical protein